jgi:O-methyltransferase involved in polyketide biosynthesis
MTEQAPRGVDTATPNVARIYDYLLGGKDNFAADRAAADHLVVAVPDIAAIAQDQRAFIARAVRFLAAEQGITQFLDLGSGLPTRSNVHQVAQAVAPEAHVVYVDHDPVVALHGQALLATGDTVAMVHADLTKPDLVLSHPDVLRVLDLTRPVALISTGTLYFVSDQENPHAVIAEYRDRVAPGSCLAISHAPAAEPEDDPEAWDEASEVYRQASSQIHFRSLAEIQRFFDGFEMIEPGLVWMAAWRPDPDTKPHARLQTMRAGVGRKP